jgi:hypothetical protein
MFAESGYLPPLLPLSIICSLKGKLYRFLRSAASPKCFHSWIRLMLQPGPSVSDESDLPGCGICDWLPCRYVQQAMDSTSQAAVSLSQWTTKTIDRECGKAYRFYEKARRNHYLSYFAQHPELRCPHQAHSACTVTAALPPGWGELQTLIARPALHRYARSGKSSQLLALALLGSAARLDPSFGWFWHALDLPTPRSAQQYPSFAFERSLSPSHLGEKPHTTQLDFAVDDPGFFVAVETKWTEQGLGICSCAPRGEGNPCAGSYCAERVIGRKRYWQVAKDFFGLSAKRLPLFACPVSPAYQAVRNVAAAQRLANSKRPFAFVLLYDVENPYFRATGTWPGWPAVLRAHLDGHEQRNLYFRAVSWQELVSKLPLDEQVCRWAREKHGLGRC